MHSDDNGPPSIHIRGYEIEALLGEGGFGEVYQCCEESGLKRTVAVKVIRLGMGTREILARFDAEMNALAKMNHPSICRVIDSGITAESQPYFAMEFIEGQTLESWLKNEQPDFESRLDIFGQLCLGISHAHERGVIHRDLKPGNVMITNSGDGPAVKVIDFGLAKALHDPLTDRTLVTGKRFTLGTWNYMSPEQAKSRGSEVDIRSDIYSMGVMLYQMVCGRLPHEEFGEMSETEIIRILEEQLPKRPSQIKVLTDQKIPGIPVKKLRTELDWIILKALASEPKRRYGTVRELQNDLQRYRKGDEAVLACPPGNLYVASKFLRRNRTLVSILVLVFFSLSIGITWALEERSRAQAQKEKAELAREEADKKSAQLQQVVNFQEEQLASIDAAAMGWGIRSLLLEKSLETPQIRSLSEDEKAAFQQTLESGLAGIDFTGLALKTLEKDFFERALQAIENFENQPLVQAQLLQTIATTLSRVGLIDLATPPQERALEIRQENLGSDHFDTYFSAGMKGRLLQSQGHFDNAIQLLGLAHQAQAKMLGEEHPVSLKTLDSLGHAHHQSGNLEMAEEIYRKVLRIQESVQGPNHPETLSTLDKLASLLVENGDYEQPEEMYLKVLSGRKEHLGPLHPDTMSSLNNLGFLAYRRGNYSEAASWFEKSHEGKRSALGAEHPTTLTTLRNLSITQRKVGQLDLAEDNLRETLEVSGKVLGSEHPSTLSTMNTLAGLLRQRGNYSEAEPLYQDSLQGRRRVLGDDHADTLTSLSNMGLFLKSQGKFAEAFDYYSEALEGRRRILGDDHRATLTTLNNLAFLLKGQGNRSESLPLFQEVLEKRTQTLGTDHPTTLISIYNLGGIFLDMENWIAAEQSLRRALEGQTQRLGVDHLDTLTTMNDLGSALRNLGQLEDSQTLCFQAYEGLKTLNGDQHPVTLAMLSNLIKTLVLQEKWEIALPLAENLVNETGREDQFFHERNTLKLRIESEAAKNSEN